MDEMWPVRRLCFLPALLVADSPFFLSYKFFHSGRPLDGEFNALTDPVKREHVINMFMGYLGETGSAEVAFSKFIFRHCFIEAPGEPHDGLHIKDPRISKEQRRAKIEESLMKNDESLRVRLFSFFFLLPLD